MYTYIYIYLYLSIYLSLSLSLACLIPGIVLRYLAKHDFMVPLDLGAKVLLGSEGFRVWGFEFLKLWGLRVSGARVLNL